MPLICAAKGGHLPSGRRLIKEKADIMAVDERGRMAIYYVDVGNTHLVELLVTKDTIKGPAVSGELSISHGDLVAGADKVIMVDSAIEPAKTFNIDRNSSLFEQAVPARDMLATMQSYTFDSFDSGLRVSKTDFDHASSKRIGNGWGLENHLSIVITIKQHVTQIQLEILSKHTTHFIKPFSIQKTLSLYNRQLYSRK